MQKVDLHIHTSFSDGAYSPEEIVYLAKDRELNVISITDHDSINGIEETIFHAKQYGIQVIPGLEISTDVAETEVHLLGYFIDIQSEELNKYLEFFREERYNRAKRIVKKLNTLGLEIDIKDVEKVAKNSAMGRPHIALALLKLGLTNSYNEAFEKYISDRGPAYERKIHVSTQSAVKLINDAGGLSFIAHPCNMKEIVLAELIKSGIDGIEVIHPSHNEYQTNFYRGIVNEYCLLESGGSDFHGGKRGDDANLGKYLIDLSKVDAMQKMIMKNTA